ncbi:T9SS type A sorting domain-containing protein [Chryseobacterium fluminis]|uniref:T9SS type A sorting domain-containing protein n=1 Tax=Chryseobacterium fluminis TaxID=2983606 RepID=UPI00224FD628|nr:T9SS type A sorting domain-containing protein [Chryseobacterium sp. MMS21-Ot14]UZT96963.1 T9SS type A sorting domain-containing protein [Chryseobacterium sp. MMS21-Ot14]
MANDYKLTKVFAFLLVSFFTCLSSAQTYCNPSYPTGCFLWRIAQVAIPQASFSNTFDSGNCVSGRDRTSITINLSVDTTYTLNVSTTNWTGCGMAVDFNKDGDFDDTGEVLFLPAYIANQNQTYTGDFIIPSSVMPGSYRMRIWNRLANSGAGTPTADSACATYGYGTWTDYTVNIASLSTTEASLQTIAKVYPNPVSDVLHIEGKTIIKSVEVFDLNGKLIKTVTHHKNKISIGVSELIPGAYAAKITDSKGSRTIKFIKK